MPKNVLNNAAQVPASPSDPSNPPLSLDFTAIATALQAIAQALLNYEKRIEQAKSSKTKISAQSEQYEHQGD